MRPNTGQNNPFDDANIFSKLFYCWLYPYFIKGYKKDLFEQDLPSCPQEGFTAKVRFSLEKNWNKELKKLETGRSPNLIRAILKTFGIQYMLNIFIILFDELFIQITQPFLLGYIVDYFGNKLKDPNSTYLQLSVTALCLQAVGMVLLRHSYVFNTQRIGMKIRVALCALMYNKSLRLSHKALQQTTIGQMVNLFSNDVSRFNNTLATLPYFILGPVQTVILVVLIWYNFGTYILTGLLLIPFYILIQLNMGRQFAKLRMKTAKLTDERVRLMNEIITGMRVIKMYAWEYAFAELVDKTRKNEIRNILRTFILKGINVGMNFVSSKLILFTSFIVYNIMEGTLDAKAVFVCMALYNNLRLSMTLFFPNAMSFGSELFITIKRIKTFLLLDEQKIENNHIDYTNSSDKSESLVKMSNVIAFWNEELKVKTLRNISFEVSSGELLMVVGEVGSGKSSLLMSILNELPIDSGDLKVNGTIAYSSQEPWILAGSVRDNILFGKEYNSRRYQTIIELSSLKRDLEELPLGDETFVGEKGVSLSGGQKARVNLARALYVDADIILLDDPLSAVDPAVSKHIFEKCIKEHLKSKIRILCTHQIQFLSQATKIIVLKEGAIDAIGTYDDLVNRGVDFGALKEDKDNDKRRESEGSLKIKEINPAIFSKMNSIQSQSSTESDTNSRQLSINKEVLKKGEDTRATGHINASVYYGYIKAGAGILIQFVLPIVYITTQVIYSYSDFFLKQWTEANAKSSTNSTVINNSNFTSLFSENLPTNKSSSSNTDQSFFIYVYSSLIGGLFFFSIFRTVLFFMMCMRASINLHNDMFRSLIRTPIAFFDINPAGNMLNRCSRDMGIIDDLLPPALSDFLEILCNVIGTIILIAIIQPFFIIPSVILAIIMVLIRNYYMATARDIKRMEGTTRSPVFTHISSSIQGLSTLRSYKAQSRFSELLAEYQDKHTSAWFMFLATSRWFNINIDMLCALFIATVTIIITSSTSVGDKGGAVGLVIASVINLSKTFQWGVRQSTEVENQMTSVERVLEYSKLQSEAELESSKDKKPPPSWPSTGAIEFKNVSLQYNSDDSPVLKNLNFEIEPEYKIGIVGRTGAGKSSILTALFRMTEPTGCISIDGVITKDIGLHDLRKKISIIPQDPVLFNGTVRKNLDPFEEHRDEILWKALNEAHLKETILDLPGALDSKISEGGSNFSVGQRQLLCLARAIIRKNKILVLDEATANVDPNTDNIIQNTIRKRFRKCTVITIAHRLNTIIDSDKILVLDNGCIREYDKPSELLQNQAGIFSTMVKSTGPSMGRHLTSIALNKGLLQSEMEEKSSEDEIEAFEESIWGKMNSALSGVDNAAFEEIELNEKSTHEIRK